MDLKKTYIALVLIHLVLGQVNADQIGEVNIAIRNVEATLAVLLFAIQGLKYITSETPADRAEAKKGTCAGSSRGIPISTSSTPPGSSCTPTGPPAV